MQYDIEDQFAPLEMWKNSTGDDQRRAEICLSWLWQYVYDADGEFDAFMQDFGSYPYKRFLPTHEHPLVLEDDLLDAAIAAQEKRNVAKYGNKQEQFDR